MDPITYGRYPRTVQDLVGDRLLKFTYEESQMLRRSYDFLGLQYYTAYYAKPNAPVDPNYIRYKTDSHIIETRKFSKKNNTLKVEDTHVHILCHLVFLSKKCFN